ncbi:hypothetical protein GCM10010116_08560 [Microbispora rosea subsp. aerata]|nr:hypothetical protein [Microbispora rosea]GGO04342.1 hypothetical protein GCM10010116_08560 [Microbispora rosea subsp. aerata]GIH54987.1 hypothetical protein Mro02_19010 [Microbispora rosea subsp. aerata]GLJ83001.1 hypothetical protein GCM10017588_17270 [Microbispora rosea subsp. aerata]
MNGAYSGWLIGAALVLALVSLITTVRNRPMGPVLLAGLGLLELAVLAQAGFALAGLGNVAEKATFIGYLAGTVVIPPAAIWWGRAERTRWGPAVIVVAAFSVAVMTGRLLQLWSAGA